FFFSSRRRHTRCYRDWSSDVCSSDLQASKGTRVETEGHGLGGRRRPACSHVHIIAHSHPTGKGGSREATAPCRPIRFGPRCEERSEERRVGKEWRTRWWSEW